ncbi:hypothetical protein K502DRAFT_324357, partial [Neoconidiobolus thromboides FSU 785]
MLFSKKKRAKVVKILHPKSNQRYEEMLIVKDLIDEITFMLYEIEATRTSIMNDHKFLDPSYTNLDSDTSSDTQKNFLCDFNHSSTVFSKKTPTMISKINDKIKTNRRFISFKNKAKSWLNIKHHQDEVQILNVLSLVCDTFREDIRKKGF